MRWVSISCRSLISRSFRALLVAALWALGGCPRPLPPPPPASPPPPPVVVPEGCLDNLGGDWTHAEDPSFHYLGEDDGGTLRLTLQRVYPDAGAFTPRKFGRDARDRAVEPQLSPREEPPDGGPTGPTVVPLTTPRIELIRTPRGFVGTTVAEVQHPSGRTCLASFPTEVVACGDAGLVLRTRSAVALGDACDAPASPGAGPSSQHVLIRGSRTADAGVPDGGWRAWVAQGARRDGGRGWADRGDAGRPSADAGAPRPRRARDAGAPSR